MKKNNPYIVGPPVSGKNKFVGQLNLLERIQSSLADPNKKLHFLFGQRRSGKTSILHQLATLLPGVTTFRPVLFDLEGKASLSLETVLQQVGAKLAQDASLNPLPLDGEIKRAFREDFLPEVLTTVPANTCLIFLFDEFDVPNTADGQQAYTRLLPYVNELLKFEPRRLSFIFAVGRQPDDLSRLSAKGSVPIEPLIVNSLSFAETETLIRLSERTGSLNWSQEAVEAIFLLTNGHPYWTQMLCQYIWHRTYRFYEGEPPTIKAADVTAVVPSLLHKNTNSFEWIWDGLNSSEQIVTAVLARAGEKGMLPFQIEQELSETNSDSVVDDVESSLLLLEQWNLIIADEDVRRFQVPLFRQWVSEFKSLNSVSDEQVLQKMADNLYQAASGFHQRGSIEQTISLLKQTIELKPNHLQANKLMAKLLISQHQIEQARQLLEKLYLYKPAAATSDLISILLQLAKSTEKETEQLSYFEKILQLEPEHKAASANVQQSWKKYGDDAFAENRFREAVFAYEKAGLPDKAITSGLQEIGRLEQEEKYDSALELAKWLDSMFPEFQNQLPDLKQLERKTHLNATYQGAISAYDDEDLETALNLFKQVVELEPTYHDALDYLYLIIRGVNVNDLRSQLELEREARQKLEASVKEESDTYIAEVQELQELVVASQLTWQKAEAKIQEETTLRNKLQFELNQLKETLEVEKNARKKAEASLNRLTRARNIWAALFGIAVIVTLFSFLPNYFSAQTTTPIPPTVTPSFLEEATEASTQETITQDVSEIKGVVNVTSLSLRVEPGIEYEAKTTLNADEILTAVARNEESDWVYVHLAVDGTEGWVPARFIDWNGDVLTLPER